MQSTAQGQKFLQLFGCKLHLHETLGSGSLRSISHSVAPNRRWQEGWGQRGLQLHCYHHCLYPPLLSVSCFVWFTNTNLPTTVAIQAFNNHPVDAICCWVHVLSPMAVSWAICELLKEPTATRPHVHLETNTSPSSPAWFCTACVSGWGQAEALGRHWVSWSPPDPLGGMNLSWGTLGRLLRSMSQ